MKRFICIALALSMLLISGCARSGFAVMTAKIVNGTQAEREAAAKDAPKGYGFAEKVFGALYTENENLACSPVSLWLAVAMLAETASGETRNEMLSLLGVSDIEAARGFARALIASENLKESKAECSIANSIWMNGSIEYKTETLETLRDVFSADSFSGDPNDAGYSKALRDWLNEKTNGLLKDAVKDMKFDPLMVLSLASTIYFDSQWVDKFDKNSTNTMTFHSPKGDRECDFMHSEEHLFYFEGEGFRAAGKRLEGGAVMWFLLPDEGKSVSEIAGGISAIADRSESHLVRLALPKLDISSDLDLIPALKALGMTSCFDPEKADFSALMESVRTVYVSEAKHAVRVKADEERVKAAAFTYFGMKETAMPPNEYIEFTLDRPFIYVITGGTGTPLFVGAVNIP